MNGDTEIRFKLPLELHKTWQRAATARGLSLKALIASTVSGELIKTGELDVTAVISTNTPQTAAKPEPFRMTPEQHAKLMADWSYDD